jgi:ADP-ribose pyrophosphatase YjhB (NUDIX family)
MTWRRRVEPLTRPLFFAFSRATRGMTLGVRGVVTDPEDRVLLIEHTYLHGWWLPGGGVDRGETIEHALARELVEEAGVRPTSRPKLLSVHSNEPFFRGDHILVYRVRDWEPVQATSRGEVLNAQFFPLDDLPHNVNPPSRRRIAEAFEGLAPDPMW